MQLDAVPSGDLVSGLPMLGFKRQFNEIGSSANIGKGNKQLEKRLWK